MESTVRVNLNKLAKVEALAFRNALRLHYDSIVLFKNGSYPSTYYLSVLASEELGKAFILGDIVFYAITGDSGDARRFPLHLLAVRGIDDVFSHRRKQVKFASQVSDLLFLSIPKGYMEGVLFGRTEVLKQKAAYVGLSRKKGRTDLKSRVSVPTTIGRKAAVKQITNVNEYLLHLTLGVMKDVYTYDNENVERLLNKRLFVRLTKSWKYRDRRGQRRFQSLQKL